VDEKLEETMRRLRPEATQLLTACGIPLEELGGIRDLSGIDPISSPTEGTLGINLKDATLKKVHDLTKAKASRTLIGYLRRNPSPRMLLDWAVQALHRSFLLITMLGGGFFEIKFQEEVGKIHACHTNTEYTIRR
jgi:hypothetical protein